MCDTKQFTQTFFKAAQDELVWNELSRLFTEDRDCVLFMFVHRKILQPVYYTLQTKTKEQITLAQQPSESLLMRLKPVLVEHLGRRSPGELIVALIDIDYAAETAYPCVGVATKSALGRGG